MAGENVFDNEWRDCLRHHFMYIVRTQDVTTEKSLVAVMQEVGFSDSDLAELRVLATMRADALPDDFVPDLAVLKQGEPAVHAVELPENYAVELQEDTPVVFEETADGGLEEGEVDDSFPAEVGDAQDDNPQQLSLF